MQGIGYTRWVRLRGGQPESPLVYKDRQQLLTLGLGKTKGKRWCYQNLEALMGDPPRLAPGPLRGLLRGGCLAF